MKTKMRTAHPEGVLVTELIIEELPPPWSAAEPKWYIDAAHIEHNQAKVRELLDTEIDALEKDSEFCGYALLAIGEYIDDYDPTPLE